MKILHISTHCLPGAGGAAVGLHLGLKSIGVDSKMLVLKLPPQSGFDTDIIQFKQEERGFFKDALNRFRDRSIISESAPYKNNISRGFDLFSGARTSFEISGHSMVSAADIINLHWISGMVDYPEFFKYLKNKPIALTLHDMNYFTGGCHYSSGCVKYKTGCGACPQLGSKDPNDLSRKIFKIKEKAYRGHNICVICDSSWMLDRAKESPLFKNFRAETCHYDTETSVFKKYDKRYSRDILKLPQDKIIVLFGAAYCPERKGLRYLIRALELLKDKTRIDIMLVTFGAEQSELSDGAFSVRQLGKMDDENVLAQVYSAADIFVIPSLEEAFGQTCLEAMSCGTAVIGSRTGGIPDMILDGKTGILVTPGNAAELARGIGWLIEHPQERDKMAKEAEAMVGKEYAFPAQARRYVKIYESMLSKKYSRKDKNIV